MAYGWRGRREGGGEGEDWVVASVPLDFEALEPRVVETRGWQRSAEGETCKPKQLQLELSSSSTIDHQASRADRVDFVWASRAVLPPPRPHARLTSTAATGQVGLAGPSRDCDGPPDWGRLPFSAAGVRAPNVNTPTHIIKPQFRGTDEDSGVALLAGVWGERQRQISQTDVQSVPHLPESRNHSSPAGGAAHPKR